MNRILEQILSGTRLLIRLWLPATVFIGMCTVVFTVFISWLGSQVHPSGQLVGSAWLLLLTFYIVCGVVFTRFTAHLLRASSDSETILVQRLMTFLSSIPFVSFLLRVLFGSETVRVQRLMAFLSGIPFYTICLLFLMMGIAFGTLYPDDCAAALFLSVVGCFGFALISGSYLLLLRFFSGRPTAIAHT